MSVELKRSLSLPMLTLYGLGTILGAGIYVLIGEVAGLAGLYAPAAFLVASVLAAFSAFSYAELAARFPLSAGEAVYVHRAFGRRWLSRLVGLLIVLVGVVSSATLVNGFVGYFRVFVDIQPWSIIAAVVLALGAVAAWGIVESVLLAALITLVEVGGLLMVLWAGRGAFGDLPLRFPELVPPADPLAWVGIGTGAFVAFYAFLGFEDIVNVAEEVKRPTRNLPLAVLLSLGVATALYMAVALVVVLAVPPAELAGSEAPLALVYERSTGRPPTFISLIGMGAVINGALVQVVLVSRVLYGMAREGWLPGWMARVHPRTRTPLHSTVLVVLAILVLALWLPLVTLAKIASLVILLVFSLVNLSLWRVKRRAPRPQGVPVFPVWLPMAGFVASLGFVVFQLLHWA